MLDRDDARLVLPKRFEVLEREAAAKNADLKQLVHRVDDAANRIDQLLRQVKDGGVGRFELFLGASGSGKTTFLRTLPKFFNGVGVAAVARDVPLSGVADKIRSAYLPAEQQCLWIMEDRDNLKVEPASARGFFESLRVLFRQREGKVVVVWPITDGDSAHSLSASAWDVGRDSIVDLSKGLYGFKGLPKPQFYEVADTTCRSLNQGQSLEAFGLSLKVADPLASESETISEYYTRLETKSAEINNHFRSVLKDKVLPRVWVLVAGDESTDLDRTVATLTQGTENRVDIDRLLEYLDNPDLDAAYLKPWKKRRDDMAYLMRKLDVRVFSLPPNASLAAVRACGSDKVRARLNHKTGSDASAVDAIQKTKFFRVLRGESAPSSIVRSTEQKTAHEYLRAQQAAAKEDKDLNKALGAVIEKALAKEGIRATVRVEKGADQGNLTPDVWIGMPEDDPVCLEPTWRSTGAEIPSELTKRQNTLTPGHIQGYVLQKVMKYVEDLDL